jgi:8-oxo-dGTP diphosphatase
MTLAGTPEFGERLSGVSYRARPGAYAVIARADGQVAVVRTPAGLFLPGGGIEPSETVPAALLREVREECGWEISVRERIGEAIQYVHAPGEGNFAKHCVFYRCMIVGESSARLEGDHQPAWISPAEAQAQLTHGSQSWAIAVAIAGSAG